MRRLLLLSVFFAATTAVAQNPLSVTLSPSGDLPIGSTQLSFGGGVTLGGEYQLSFLRILSPRLEVGYGYLPAVTESGVNLFQAGAGISLRFGLGERLSAVAGGTAGYYYGTIGGTGGGNLYARGNGGLEVSLSDTLGLGLRGRYQWMADGAGGSLFSGIGVSVALRYTVLTSRRLQIDPPVIDPVFPVLYKYYADNAVGTIHLSNPGSIPMEDVRSAFYVSEFMNGPTSSVETYTLEAGAELAIPVNAIFSDRVLDITEGEVVSGRVQIEYTMRGKAYNEEFTVPIRFYDRHAITWDDDRKAGAYVTAKDPLILEFVKPIAGWVRESGQAGVDTNLQTAIAIHETLRLMDISYVIDPQTPYAELSGDATAIDYLQFPVNTLSYGAGDCDDLSILYASMLQAVGIETAFITIPGHIYIAFALNSPPEEAVRMFLREEELIVHDGRAWMPLEATLIQQSFLEAWTTGASQWLANEESALILPLYTAWREYDPVEAVTTGDLEVQFPSTEAIQEAYDVSWQQFANREIRSRIRSLESRIASTGNVRYVNNLGVLYARYGLVEEAGRQFEAAIESGYVPAMINLGNLLLLEGDAEGAIVLYENSIAIDPNNPTALLQMARAAYEIGDHDLCGEFVDRLRPVAPELIREFAYLESADGSAGRASAALSLLEVMVWDEE